MGIRVLGLLGVSWIASLELLALAFWVFDSDTRSDPLVAVFVGWPLWASLVGFFLWLPGVALFTAAVTVVRRRRAVPLLAPVIALPFLLAAAAGGSWALDLAIGGFTFATVGAVFHVRALGRGISAPARSGRPTQVLRRVATPPPT